VLINYNASSICVKFSFQISGPCTYNSLCMSWNSAPLASTPIWARDFASPEELVKEFNHECRIVQKGRKFLSLWDKWNCLLFQLGGLMSQLHHGMVKLLPIMLGKAPGESLRAKLGDSPNLIMHKDKGHFMKLRSSWQIRWFYNMFNRIFWSLSWVYDHHQKIMSCNVVEKTV
jgi:hypothetical protein